MTILVSACLLGVPCRYDGLSKPNEKVLALSKTHTLVPVCPEQLGGRPTPRNPVELKNGRVQEQDGTDHTQAFLQGARQTVRIATIAQADCAILKAKSPSCGFGAIYDGSFTRTRPCRRPVFPSRQNWIFRRMPLAFLYEVYLRSL